MTPKLLIDISCYCWHDVIDVLIGLLNKTQLQKSFSTSSHDVGEITAVIIVMDLTNW